MARSDFIPAARLKLLTPLFDTFCRAVGLGEALRRFEVSLMEGLSPKRVLEVGCGTGELLRGLVRRFPESEVTGLDPDETALAKARVKLEAEKLSATLVAGRAEGLQFPDGIFDLVVSSLMLHHLDSATKVRALREWRRVLAPGGCILLVDLGVPRSAFTRVLLWPLKFPILEEQADNLRGHVPAMLRAAGLVFEEVGVYRSAVVAYRASAA